PHIGRAARIAVPRLGHTGEVGPGHVPRPGEFAGNGVESLDHAGGRIALLPVQHLVAGHHIAAHDNRRRGDRDHAGHHLAHAGGYVDRTILAELGAGAAGTRIDRDDAAVERALDYAGCAGLVFRRIGNLVIGHAPTGGGVGNIFVRHLRVVAPQFAPDGG